MPTVFVVFYRNMTEASAAIVPRAVSRIGGLPSVFQRWLRAFCRRPFHVPRPVAEAAHRINAIALGLPVETSRDAVRAAGHPRAAESLTGRAHAGPWHNGGPG